MVGVLPERYIDTATVPLDSRTLTSGTHISDQIYDGRYFDPSTRAAINAVWQLAEPATGTVKLLVLLKLFQGNPNYTPPNYPPKE